MRVWIALGNQSPIEVLIDSSLAFDEQAPALCTAINSNNAETGFCTIDNLFTLFEFYLKFSSSDEMIGITKWDCISEYCDEKQGDVVIFLKPAKPCSTAASRKMRMSTPEVQRVHKRSITFAKSASIGENKKVKFAEEVEEKMESGDVLKNKTKFETTENLLASHPKDAKIEVFETKPTSLRERRMLVRSTSAEQRDGRIPVHSTSADHKKDDDSSDNTQGPSIPEQPPKRRMAQRHSTGAQALAQLEQYRTNRMASIKPKSTNKTIE
jgi:hypothetical protein